MVLCAHGADSDPSFLVWKMGQERPLCRLCDCSGGMRQGLFQAQSTCSQSGNRTSEGLRR